MKRTTAALEMSLFFLVFFFPGYLAQAWGYTPGPITSSLLLQSVVTGLPQFVLMAYVIGVRGPAASPLWGFVPLERRDALRIAALVGVCFLFIAVIGGISLILPRRWSQTLGGGFRWGLQNSAQIPLAILFGLTSGYREELFFRSYLLERLQEIDAPLPFAVAGSVVLFSVGHVYEGILGVAVTAILGLILSAAYLKRRSIHVIALSHALYNAIALIISLFLTRALPGGIAVRILVP